MSKEAWAHFIAGCVGLFAVLISIFGLIRGDPFSDNYLGLLCGVSLLGVAIIHRKSRQ